MQPNTCHNICPSIKRYVLQLTAVTALCLSNGMYGFLAGFTSPIEAEVIRSGVFNTFTFSLFSSLTLFGLSSLVIGPVAAKLSNKFVLIITSLIGGMGWVLIIIGHDIYSMIFGRFLTGIQIGGTLTLTIYMSEISDAKNKKFYPSLIIFSSDCFLFLTYLIGNFLSFRWLAVTALLTVFIQTVLLICCLQSPVWLIRIGCMERAQTNLITLNGNDFDVNKEIELLQHDFTQNTKISVLGIFRWSVLKPILVACALQFFKGLSGQSIFLFYSSSLFTRTGLDPNLSTLPYPLLIAVGVILSAMLTKMFSRKKMLISTTAMQGVANFSFFLYYFITRSIEHCSDPFSSFQCFFLSFWPIFNMSVYSFTFGIGWGTISWSMFADSFDPKYKEISAGIVTFWFTLVSTITLLIFPNFVITFGFWPIFIIFTINCFVATCFEAIFF